MKKSIFTIVALIAMAFATFAQKQVSQKTHIKFFSTTSIEDIEANNYASTGVVNTETGNIVFSVPMQSFEFEKSLMQKHFNSKKFLHTKANPKAKLVGKITDLSAVNFSKDGDYTVDVKGDLTINGVTNPINEKVNIAITNGKMSLNSTFNVTLADYDIVFKRGKPSKNIAKTVEVTVVAEY